MKRGLQFPQDNESAMAKILVIDEKPYIGDLLSEELKDERHTVVAEVDGESAMDYLRDSRADMC